MTRADPAAKTAFPAAAKQKPSQAAADPETTAQKPSGTSRKNAKNPVRIRITLIPAQMRAGINTVLRPYAGSDMLSPAGFSSLTGSAGFSENIRFLVLVRYKGKQGYDPGLLDSDGQCPLMFRAGTGNTPGKDLPPLGNKAAECIRIFIVNFHLLDTEFANPLFKESFAAFSAPAEFIIAVTAFHLAVHAPVPPERAFAIHIFFIRHNVTP